jgi:hypothetical protein
VVYVKKGHPNPGLGWGAVETVVADSKGLVMRNFICPGVIAVQVSGSCI